LFFGIGGIELGIERTRYFRTKWAVENDEFCRSIIRKHWPGIPIYGDIREIDWNAVPRVDMLTGGFPCQDISTANPRGEGIEGSRSGLWREFAKAIGILRPKYALIENVPAIVRKGLNVVLADLAEAGYDAEWFDLRASDFGALHKRERIFIVAHSDSLVFTKSRDDGEVREIRESALGEDSECIAPDPDPIVRHGILRGQLDNAGRVIADDYRERVQRFVSQKIQTKQGFSWCKDVGRVEDLQGRLDIPEPLFRGARDGVPDWVDRIKALGNAVVPDCAEFIGEMIMEFDKRFGVNP